MSDRLAEIARKVSRRISRRNKSGCTKIKRSAVCKRTEGCSYASGTKRRFCRKAKNTRRVGGRKH